MPKENFCCDKFGSSIKDESITEPFYSFEKKYKIYGKPESSYDGGGCLDDMTEKIEIDFCPFCGEKLTIN